MKGLRVLLMLMLVPAPLIQAGTVSTSPPVVSESTAADARTGGRLSVRQQRQREVARAERQRQARCTRLRQRRDRIDRQLDAGYREPRGNRLRQQRREVQSQLFRECR